MTIASLTVDVCLSYKCCVSLRIPGHMSINACKLYGMISKVITYGNCRMFIRILLVWNVLVLFASSYLYDLQRGLLVEKFVLHEITLQNPNQFSKYCV